MSNAKIVKIAHLFPELLNLYGDSGNLITLAKRMQWRGMSADIAEVSLADTLSLSAFDIVFIGGGSDREQAIVARRLQDFKKELASFVQDGGVLLAVCGGYQLLGDYYMLGQEKVQGLSLIDFYTDRDDPRLIGNIVVETDLSKTPVVGYENHGGRTYLGSGVKPFGRVIYGHGNDGESGFEGARYKNVLGTYIHGPLLPKNPGIADWALRTALEKKYGAAPLEPLDDEVELLANQVMRERLLSGKVLEG